MLGERCGLCLQIWRLVPVVNIKRSQTAKTEARTVYYAFEFGVSFLLLTLSIVTDGEDRGENCGLCLQIWRLFPVVNTKHTSQTAKTEARTVDYAFEFGVSFPLL